MKRRTRLDAQSCGESAGLASPPNAYWDRHTNGSFQRIGVCVTKPRALPIGFLEGIREPHHTPRVVTVGEPIRVGELMNRLGCRSVHEPSAIPCVEPRDGKDRDSAFCIRLAEYEVQIWRIEIGIGDAK